MELFDSFGDYLKKTIEASPEWQAYVKRSGGAPAGGSGMEDMDDDLPF